MMGGRSMVLSTGVRTVPAGRVTLVAANRGTRPHELVVLPLPAGQPAGVRAVAADDTVDESGSLGEASRSCAAGEGPGIAAGATGWMTLDLRPGRYELVCNRPDTTAPAWPPSSTSSSTPSALSCATRERVVAVDVTGLPVRALVVSAPTHENRSSELLLEHLTPSGEPVGAESCS